LVKDYKIRKAIKLLNILKKSLLKLRAGKETAEHVLLYCDNTPQRAWSRGAQFRKLASEPAAVGQITRQLIQCERLG
jgi:hypothetical protein